MEMPITEQIKQLEKRIEALEAIIRYLGLGKEQPLSEAELAQHCEKISTKFAKEMGLE